jgi:hypothetical protein
MKKTTKIIKMIFLFEIIKQGPGTKIIQVLPSGSTIFIQAQNLSMNNCRYSNPEIIYYPKIKSKLDLVTKKFIIL